MNRYIQISVQTRDTEESDRLIARLAEAGYEGFEEEPKKLHAFIPESLYDPVKLEIVIDQTIDPATKHDPPFRVITIEPRNWNAEWEKDFEPVIIGDYCAIRAGFHPAIPGVTYDLVITPKMSFGTGHHATTHMMVEITPEINFTAKRVLDFGTGTGILAILASKAGAGSVLAIDNDDWSIENALENAALNQAGHIDIRKADSLKETGVFDIILGNINLQVILEIIPVLRQHLTPDGVFIGSGVLESDEEKIRQAAGLSGLQMEKRKIRDNWICFSLKNSLSK